MRDFQAPRDVLGSDSSGTGLILFISWSYQPHGTFPDLGKRDGTGPLKDTLTVDEMAMR